VLAQASALQQVVAAQLQTAAPQPQAPTVAPQPQAAAVCLPASATQPRAAAAAAVQPQDAAVHLPAVQPGPPAWQQLVLQLEQQRQLRNKADPDPWSLAPSSADAQLLWLEAQQAQVGGGSRERAGV
jgi:hypothetical protein